MNRMKSLIFVFFALILAGSAGAENWWETIKIKGDFRYRHEMIDEEGSDAVHRHRIRARLGISGMVNNTTKVGIQLATGKDDPVSTNQTLSGSFSTKAIMLDKAYLAYTPEEVAGMTIAAGKFSNPFFKPGSSELIWDSDMNPEGGTFSFKSEFNNLTLNLIGAGLWIEQRSDDKDSWLGAGQAILDINLNDEKTAIAVGGSFFNYVNTAGFEPFYSAENNTLDGSGNYLNDYELFEAMLEISTKVNDFPVTVMGDFVSNTAADSLDTGWLIGIHLGKAKNPGSWAARYNYRKVEKDAVVGIFTDSDFRGGGTDTEGHELGGSYQLGKNSAFNLTYFINTADISSVESDYNKLQADLQLKF